MFQESGLATGVSAAQENNLATQRGLEVELPVRGEGATGRGLVDAGSQALAISLQEAGGALSQSLGMFMVEAVPDLLLPEVVEAFDESLEAGFAGRGKDGDDLQSQAKADDATQDIRAIVGTLEAGIVIKLRVERAALSAPMRDDLLGRKASGDSGGRPSLHGWTPERLGGEDVNWAEAFQSQVLNDIEGVKFGLTLGGAGQVPSRGRRGSAESALVIEQAFAAEDAADSADAGLGLGRQEGLQLFGDGLSADKAKSALGVEFPSERDDQTNDSERSLASLVMRGMGTGEPIHLSQGAALSPLEPILNGVESDLKLLSHSALGEASADGGDKSAAFSEQREFSSAQCKGRAAFGPVASARPFRLASLAETDGPKPLVSPLCLDHCIDKVTNN